jgi:uncharacterized membrane protein YoaK (UPF0700 family)
MAAPTSAADVGASVKDKREESLPPLLFVLTVVTGLVDAVSYLKLGHVFVANMTGNVVFLGFAIAGAPEFSIAASLIAIAAFLLGALAGGRLGSRMAQQRSRFLTFAIFAKLGLVGVALLVTIVSGDGELVPYGLITLLALAMGLQNATARVLAVPDLTTTVLTLTLTGLAADSTLAGGTNPRAGRRLLATGAMLFGAAVGAFLVLHTGIAAALALTFTLLGLNAFAAYRVHSRPAA